MGRRIYKDDEERRLTNCMRQRIRRMDPAYRERERVKNREARRRERLVMKLTKMKAEGKVPDEEQLQLLSKFGLTSQFNFAMKSSPQHQPSSPEPTSSPGPIQSPQPSPKPSKPSVKVWFPIHDAAVSGKCELISRILHIDTAEIHRTTLEGDTPLILACNGGHLDAVKLLLSKGADPNKARLDKRTPLLSAMKSGNHDCVKVLIEAGANVSFQYFNGWSLLHEAACQGLYNITDILIKAGATLDMKDNFGITPLFIAAQYGRCSCLRILIRAATARGLSDLINTPSNDGATPLFIAAQENHKSCVQILLSYNADPSKSTKDGILPLHVAVQVGNVECVDILLKNMDFDELKNNFLSPLFLAIDWQRHEVLKKLISSGLPLNPSCILYVNNYTPSVSVPINYGRFMTPLARSIIIKDLKAAEMLLTAGVSPCPTSSDEFPAIIPASDKGDIAALELLMRFGLDINWKSSENVICPDILYFSLDNPELVEMLLKSGLNIRQCFDCDCNKENQNRISLCKVIPLYRKKMHVGTSIEKILMFTGPVHLCDNILQCLSKDTHWPQLRNVIENPRSLKHLCRLAIVRNMNSEFLEILPDLLKEYLSFFYFCY